MHISFKKKLVILGIIFYLLLAGITIGIYEGIIYLISLL